MSVPNHTLMVLMVAFFKHELILSNALVSRLNKDLAVFDADQKPVNWAHFQTLLSQRNKYFYNSCDIYRTIHRLQHLLGAVCYTGELPPEIALNEECIINGIRLMTHALEADMLCVHARKK